MPAKKKTAQKAKKANKTGTKTTFRYPKEGGSKKKPEKGIS